MSSDEQPQEAAEPSEEEQEEERPQAVLETVDLTEIGVVPQNDYECFQAQKESGDDHRDDSRTTE